MTYYLRVLVKSQNLRVFKNKPFTRFARQEKIADAALCDAVARAQKGLIDADLGGGVIKQRIARPQQGRSGGFRSMLIFSAMDRAFFVYGFAKNARANIRPDELTAMKKLASVLLGYTDTDLTTAIQSGDLVEVDYHEQDENLPE
jgi:hypothetical protein